MKRLLFLLLLVAHGAHGAHGAQEPVFNDTLTGKIKVSPSGVGTAGKPFDWTDVFAIGLGGGGGGGAVNTVFGRSGDVIATIGDYDIPKITGLQLALDAKQNLDADLTALAGLTGTNTIYYRSAANIWSPVTIGANMTFVAGVLDSLSGGGGGTGDFSTDTATSVLNEIVLFGDTSGKLGTRATGTGIVTATSGVYGTITNSSTDWNTAYTDRFKWDGGSTGLVAATGRISLGLVIGTNVQAYDPDLTVWAGKTPYAGILTITTGKTVNFTNSMTITGTDGNTYDLNNAAAVLIGKELWVDSVNGNDGTGTRGNLNKPFLTIAAGLAVASAGDVVYIGPGTYAQSTTPLVIPAGVTVVGSGADFTTITSAVTNATNRCSVEGLTGGALANLTIQNTASSGTPFGTRTSSTAFTSFDLSSIKTVGISDGIVIGKTGTTGLHGDGLSINSQGTGISFFVDGTHIFTGSAIIVDGTATSGEAKGLQNDGASVVFRDGSIFVANPGESSSGVPANNATAITELHNVAFTITGGTPNDLKPQLSSTTKLDNVTRSDGAALAISGSATVTRLDYVTNNLSMGTGKLLGRSTAGTGVVEEITLGTGLSFSGTTLNSSGGGGGTPGGSDTQVQFNDATAFGGDAGFTYNKTTDVLTLGGIAGGFKTTTSVQILQDTNTITLWNTGVLGWSSSANANGGADVGISRVASGVLRTNQGTTATFGDMQFRGVITNAVVFASRITTPTEGTRMSFTDSTTNVAGATITGGGSNHVGGYYNGTNWVVDTGAGGGSGTVTSIASANGITLTPDPLIATGTVGVDPADDLAHTVAQTITTAPGVTTKAPGLTLQNVSATVANASQYSPELILIGQGRKTGGTPADQAVEFHFTTMPAAGSASATGSLELRSIIAGGTAVPSIKANTAGGVTIGAGPVTAPNGVLDATVGFQVGTAATTNTILVGDGTKYAGSAYTVAAPGTTGNVLTSDGTNWTSAAAAGGSVSDTAFASSWDTVTTIAPSKNAVYDWAHLFDTDDDGLVNKVDLTTAGAVTTNASGVLSSVAPGTSGNVLTSNGTSWASSAPAGGSVVRLVGATWDGGGTALPTGSVGYHTVPYSGTITGWSISADAGTCTVKTWKKANGTAVPTVADIISSAGVQLTTGTHVRSSTVSDFSVGTGTAVTAGDIFAFDLSAVATATLVTFQLEITQ